MSYSSAPAVSAVCFRDVVCLIHRFPVLAGVDLDVNVGEALIIRGSNGSGKTSLLRAIAGLASIKSGSATVLGIDVVQHAIAVRAMVGFVGHREFLYDELSVSENLSFLCEPSRSGTLQSTHLRVSKQHGFDKRSVFEALETLQIDKRLLNVEVANLSAGQRRKIALCALVARNPAIWLLDEPHAALDDDARGTINRVVESAIDNGKTVIISTHDKRVDIQRPVRELQMSGGLVIGQQRVAL